MSGGLRVLVVSPHRDDETIGCGGVICGHADRGDEVWVVHLTGQGGASAAEAREACRLLGVARIVTLSGPSVGLHADDVLLGELVEVYRQCGPDVVYAPHPGEDDPTHRTAAALAAEARWMAAYPVLPDRGAPLERPPSAVYEYEVWTPLARPSMYRDISAHRERKAQALAAYGSQLRLNQWVDGALGLNRYRGVTSGCGEWVEAFSVVRGPHPLDLE